MASKKVSEKSVNKECYYVIDFSSKDVLSCESLEAAKSFIDSCINEGNEFSDFAVFVGKRLSVESNVTLVDSPIDDEFDIED